MKRYCAWGHDGSFRFKWQAKLWAFLRKIRKGRLLTWQRLVTWGWSCD